MQNVARQCQQLVMISSQRTLRLIGPGGLLWNNRLKPSLCSAQTERLGLGEGNVIHADIFPPSIAGVVQQQQLEPQPQPAVPA